MGEASLKEDTLMRVLIIGLKRELPLSPTDSLDIADRLVARAASAHTDGGGLLLMQILYKQLSIIAPYIYTMPIPILSTAAIFVILLESGFLYAICSAKIHPLYFFKIAEFPYYCMYVSETSDHQLQS